MPDIHQLRGQCFDCQGLALPVHSLHSQHPISTPQPPSFIPVSGCNKHWTLTNHWTHFILLALGLHPARSSAEVSASPNDSALSAVKAISHIVTVVPAVHGANSQHRKPEKIITPSKLIFLSMTCKLTESHSVLEVFPNANHSVSQLLISAHARCWQSNERPQTLISFHEHITPHAHPTSTGLCHFLAQVSPISAPFCALTPPEVHSKPPPSSLRWINALRTVVGD